MDPQFRERYGEWAIVTGASSGIGEAFAHTLAARGLRPLLVARRPEELRRVAEAVEARHGVACDMLALDLADPSFVDALVRACDGRDVGLVVGNAAYNPAGAFADMSRETLMRMLDVSDRANVLLAEAFLPRLAARGRGGFLLVGSTEGFIGTPWSAAYSATKAFLLSFGEALWGEYREKGVDVLVLIAGATDTPLFASRDLGDMKVRVMSPYEVAEIGLGHLGDGPSVVAGRGNQWTYRIMRRLPRKWVIEKTGPVVRAMVKRSRK
jgi:short-subunit dehydrogenase